MTTRLADLLAAAAMLVSLGAADALADVTTRVVGTKLVITGDRDPNAIAIQPAGDGGITVVGQGTTLVDGSSVGTTVPGVTRLVVKLRHGGDLVTVTQVTLREGIVIRLGKGNDTVLLDRVDAGATRVRTGGGHDAVRVYGPSRHRHLSVLTSRGFDWVDVQDAWIPGDLYVDTGSEDDVVSLFLTDVGDDAAVYLGSDEDVLYLTDVWVYDDTDLDGDDGDDWLFFAGYVWFDDEVDIDGFGDDDWWY